MQMSDIKHVLTHICMLNYQGIITICHIKACVLRVPFIESWSIVESTDRNESLNVRTINYDEMTVEYA